MSNHGHSSCPFGAAADSIKGRILWKALSGICVCTQYTAASSCSSSVLRSKTGTYRTEFAAQSQPNSVCGLLYSDAVHCAQSMAVPAELTCGSPEEWCEASQNRAHSRHKVLVQQREALQFSHPLHALRFGRLQAPAHEWGAADVGICPYSSAN